ncbi:hypothetical protein GCM10008915_35930 [Bifidobacterium pullorum subsp. gallinarum]
MKKSMYLIGGVLVGFVLATSTGAFADAVSSMIGKKVTGEYTIIVNGTALTEKGAIIDSKANVPVRGIADALGANVAVSGKTITITQNKTEDVQSVAQDTTTEPADVLPPAKEDIIIIDIPEVKETDNEYMGRSKSDLEGVRDVLINRILEPTKASKEKLLKELEAAKKVENSDAFIATIEKEIAAYDADITKYTADLAKVEAAIAAATK